VSFLINVRDQLLDRDVLPDAVVRAAIRQILKQRLRGEAKHATPLAQLVEDLRASPIAVHTQAANAQHYEVPAAFFERVLGPRMKYSCGYWEPGRAEGSGLDAAEEAMLALTVERAQIADGQRILELGCGWGSLTLYMAERFPNCEIVAMSNSSSQRAFIDDRAAARRLTNVCSVTADMNSFDPIDIQSHAQTAARGSPSGLFDRIVSVEMFEHMRNYARLLARIATWLTPEGKLFVHIFSHRRFAYPYETRGSSDWMAEHFFTGGMMPSDGLLYHFQDDLTIEGHWRVDGKHYQRTSDAWLANMDAHRDEIDRVLAGTYGPASARWRVRWRVFFMACAELFGYHDGDEWQVSHYRFHKAGQAA
jgi:cyclopropane-fatty-acyl-phospholipid synthase